jgi:alpha-1,2-mannosyltransferase
VSFVPLLISPISWSHHWVFLLVPAHAALFGSWTADRARRAFAIAVLAATLLQPLRWLPGGADVELRYPWWLHLLTSVYPLLAVAWTALVLTELRRATRDDGAPGVTAPSPRTADHDRRALEPGARNRAAVHRRLRDRAVGAW